MEKSPEPVGDGTAGEGAAQGVAASFDPHAAAEAAALGRESV